MRAIGAVKKMKATASAMLKKQWNSTTSRAGSSFRPAIQSSTWPTSGIASRQPMSLNRKLPSVTRRASGGERSVDSMPRRPLPRLAPSTRPSATGSAMTLQRGERGDQQHDREARIAQHRQQRRDQHVEQQVAGQRREDDFDAGGLDDGACRHADPLQREDDEPESDQDAPEAADGARLAWRGTGRRRRRSAAARATRGRSESTTVTSDVPTSAPSMTASAGAVPISALTRECRDDQRRGGAALDKAGDTDAGEEGGHAIVDTAPQQAAKGAAVHAQDAGPHDMRAPDEERHAGK